MVRLHIFFLVALAAVANADHHITFHNRCASRTITPTFHAADGTTRSMRAIAKGQTTSTTVAEAKAAWRIFGQTGSCSHPDGEYMNATTQQDGMPLTFFFQVADAFCWSAGNLSRVDGFNVGMEFSWSDHNCKGNFCLHPTCDGDRAFSTANNGGASLRQCNTPNVGMTVTFSCDH
ncbi:hypothetical protein B0H19DRAFT_1270898 [Mycena capillaripes]|nr:hypothetical protein B0H19DRAFT_1270898 [Mycena capillaripes]